MLDYAQFSDKAISLVDRLDNSHNKHTNPFSLFAACFTQFYIKSSQQDALLIRFIAQTLSDVQTFDLFNFIKNQTNYSISELSELEQFKNQVLIGIYLKVWSKHKYSLIPFTKSHFAELLESDLDLSKRNRDINDINTAIDALSQYISYIFINQDDNESYKELNSQLGVAIQTELVHLKSMLCAEVSSAKNGKPKIWSQNYEKNNSQYNFDAFQAYMLDKDFYSTITSSPKSQNEFYKSIKKCVFTSEHTLKLINCVTDDKVRTLLIVLLLSKKSFYENLQEESILTRLKQDEHVPSRLNALIHRMDVSVLSLDLIKELQPEAAISLIFSAPHFHLLNDAKLQVLLDKLNDYPVISYWLKHFYAAPNAHYVLAIFIKLQKELVSTEMKKLPAEKKVILFEKAMQHLELFNSVDEKYELFNCNILENNLTLSIQYFLNGHTDNAYANYINAIFKRLINIQHQFSLETIVLLTHLIGRTQFKDLNANSIYLIQFLKYYKDKPEGIMLLIYQYLTLFSNKPSFECERTGLHTICPLINDPTIDLKIRESLFKGFLPFPKLFDDKIHASLFQFNPQKLIEYFGLQGGEENYRRVISLCKWAEQHLNTPNNNSVHLIIKQALFEAENELGLSKSTGFFSKLFRRLIRCWIYGWTGFLNPKSPQFVALCDLDKPANSEVIVGFSGLSKFATEADLQDEITHLLTDLKNQYNGYDLKQLAISLNNYSYKLNPQAEYDIRSEFDTLYCDFKKSSSTTNDSEYIANQELFIKNRLRLVEMQLIAGKKSELVELIKKIDESDRRLQSIKKEMDSVLPKLKDDESLQKSPLISAVNTNISSASDNTTNSVPSTFFNNSIPTSNSSRKVVVMQSMR